MRKNILKINLVSILVLTFTATVAVTQGTPTSTTTAPTTQTEIPTPPKVVSYYGYSYRSFVGVKNPGPVNLTTGDMQLHVLSLKYNFNQKWAARAGSAYLIHNLNMEDKRPVPANMRQDNVFIEGFGDVRAAALYTVKKEKTESLDFVLGLNIPTAVILKDDSGKYLPPQDQFSSGTYDPMIAVNYSRTFENNVSIAQKLDWVFHTGISPAGYQLGDDFGATTSVSYSVKPWLIPALSARFTDRKDLAINNFHSPKRANVKFGSGWEGQLAIRSGMPLKADQSLRLGIEAGAPIFRTSNTSQYAVGETLWYIGSNLTATY